MPIVKTQFPATLNLADLTPKTGFKIIGNQLGGRAGYSVSNAGDFNQDNIDDVIISEYNFLSVYVIFGASSIGSLSSVALSSLPSTSSGLLIYSEILTEQFGVSVSGVGDINGDGYADFVIGAPPASLLDGINQRGHSYVVFGTNSFGATGFNIQDTSLTGKIGFLITGVSPGDFTGNAVSKVGDVNGDGIDDFAIAAPRFDGQPETTGVVYVVFGAKSIGSSGLLALSSLNGTNGFKIVGAVSALGNNFAYSVSSAGDINLDGISDFVVGAPYANNNTGITYVIFGARNIGNNGTLAVSSLNGSNGFRIIDAAANDTSGISVSHAGDVNGDGFSDLIIGAPQLATPPGVSYVVFGARNIGNSGVFSLFNLNGSNGFKITSSNINDGFGISVSDAGDINADNISDLIIGAFSTNNNTGASYVIFGARDIGHSGTLALSSLDGRNGFAITGVATGDQSGTSVSSAGDINADGVDDLIIGAPSANQNLGGAYVIFGRKGAQLINNALTIDQGKTVTLLHTDLRAVDLDNAANSPNLIFHVSQVQYGFFQLSSTPNVSVNSFTQNKIENSVVQFVHDGSAHAPSYHVVLSDGLMSTTPQPSDVHFYLLPTLVNNTLTISQGEQFILTNAQLGAIDPGMNPADLLFTAKSLVGGVFQWENTTKTFTFTQSQINNASVAFVQDGTSTVPSYAITLSNGRVALSPQYSNVTFHALAQVSEDANDLKKKILGASISGFIGFSFLIAKLAITYYAQKRLKEVLEPAEEATDVEQRLTKFRKEVVIQLTKKLLANINTTYLMGYRSESDTRGYVSAVESIVIHLHNLGVDINMDKLSAEEQTRFFREVVRQCKCILVPVHSYCSLSYAGSFFKPDLTPEKLEQNAELIAQSVATELKNAQDKMLDRREGIDINHMVWRGSKEFRTADDSHPGQQLSERFLTPRAAAKNDQNSERVLSPSAADAVDAAVDIAVDVTMDAIVDAGVGLALG